MHLVHDAKVKFAKLRLILLFAVISVPSTICYSREIDLTDWQSMDQAVYQSLIHGIQPGDTVMYRVDGVLHLFNIEKRLNKFDKTQGSMTDVFLLDNKKVLRIPEETILGGLQEVFVKTQKRYADAGGDENARVDVVSISPDSHPPDFVLVDYVNYKFGIKEALPFILSGDASWIWIKTNKVPSPKEGFEIRAAGFRFLRGLAKFSEGSDFGMQQIVYDLDNKEFKIIDFLAEPELFDVNSKSHQPFIIDNDWVDLEYSKKYGDTAERPNKISLRTYKRVTEIIQQERNRIRALNVCNEELGDEEVVHPLLHPPSLQPPPLHPQGPTGT